jgi:hypothetical protein
MFKKIPIIKYESCFDIFPNSITPAKSNIPLWYKKISRWKNNEMFSLKNELEHKTIKHCMPFFDTLTTGYMINLPFDIYILNKNGKILVTWKHDLKEEQVSFRQELSLDNIFPAGHYPIEFVWRFGCSFVVPKEYSVLLCHPLNRYDLPFTTLSGILEGGYVVSADGNIPFYIKDGFEGIIHKGTPIAQLIPFRQENWSSKIEKGLVEEGKKNGKRSTSVFSDWYKKTHWKKKNYE